MRGGGRVVRRPLAAIGLVVAMLGLLAGCSSDEGGGTTASSTVESAASVPAGVAALRPKASAIADLMIKGDWAGVRRDVDATLESAPQTSEAGLAAGWKQITDRYGPFKARSESIYVPKPGPYTVFDTPVQFERGVQKIRITLNAEAKISGLFILPPDAP